MIFVTDMIVYILFIIAFNFLNKQRNIRLRKINKNKIPYSERSREFWWIFLLVINFLDIIFRLLIVMAFWNDFNSIYVCLYRNIWSTVVYFLFNGQTFLRLFYLFNLQRRKSSNLRVSEITDFRTPG